MDSVTQIALGAGVAEAVLGRKLGNQAALAGAVLGTLFTQGFYAARRYEDGLLLSDLRMGVEGAYTFNFRVADIRDGVPVPVPARAETPPFRGEQLLVLLRRTFSPVGG